MQPPPVPPMPQNNYAPPQQTMNQASIMPQGPTVVVHSKTGAARPYNPQLAMYTPPPQNAPMAVPSAPVASAPLPPMAPSNAPIPSRSANAFPRAPASQNAPSYLNSPMAQPQQQSTSLAALHPIPAAPAQNYADNSGSMQDANSFDPNALQPIPTNNIRILPASRYSAMRSDSRDASGY